MTLRIAFASLLFSAHTLCFAATQDFGASTEPRPITSCVNYLVRLSRIEFPSLLVDAVSSTQDSHDFIRAVLKTPSGRRFLEEHIFFHREHSLFQKSDEVRLDPGEISERTLLEFVSALNEWGQAEPFLALVRKIRSRFLLTMSQTPLASASAELNKSVKLEMPRRPNRSLLSEVVRWLTFEPKPPRLLVPATVSTLDPALQFKYTSLDDQKFSHYSVEGGKVIAHYEGGKTISFDLPKNTLFPPHRFENGSLLIRMKELFNKDMLSSRGWKSSFFPAQEFLILTNKGEAINFYALTQHDPGYWIAGVTTDQIIFGLEFAGVLSSERNKTREIFPYVRLYQLDQNHRASQTFLQLPVLIDSVKAGRENDVEKAITNGNRYFLRNYRFEEAGPSQWRLLLGDKIILKLSVDANRAQIILE